MNDHDEDEDEDREIETQERHARLRELYPWTDAIVAGMAIVGTLGRLVPILRIAHREFWRRTKAKDAKERARAKEERSPWRRMKAWDARERGESERERWSRFLGELFGQHIAAHADDVIAIHRLLGGVHWPTFAIAANHALAKRGIRSSATGNRPPDLPAEWWREWGRPELRFAPEDAENCGVDEESENEGAIQ